MAEIRVNKILRKYNIGLSSLAEFLKKKGVELDNDPNAKISDEYIRDIEEQFGKDLALKEAAEKADIKINEILEKNSKKETPDYSKQRNVDNEEDDDSDDIHETIIKSTTFAPQKISSISDDSKNEVVQVADFSSEGAAKNDSNILSEEEKDNQSVGVVDEVVIEKTAAVVDNAEEGVKTENQNPLVNKENSAAEVPEANATIPLVKPKEQAWIVSTDKETNLDKQEGSLSYEQEPKLKINKEDNSSVNEGQGLKIIGKIDMSKFAPNKNKRRERISKGIQKVDVDKLGKEDDSKKEPRKNNGVSANNNQQGNSNRNNQNRNNRHGNRHSRGGKKGDRNDLLRPALSKEQQEELQKEIQKQVKETYARMNDNKKSNFGAKYRKEKRELASQKALEEMQQEVEEQKILKVTEFVTVNDLAILMNNTSVNKVISACMSLGLMVSINQRLDAEALVLVAEEFGYKVEFVTASLTEEIEQAGGEVADKEEDLVERPPIITVMGHVDHGKTSLLDSVRNANVIAGEAGGITQHIGAYNVKLANGRRITFLDTPGHEAFTAMRARGAQLTDLAIIIIAADDAVMPQTVEAINHAQAAGVPMVFAINKIDKQGAHPEKIYEQLSQMNILTENWGGKYQCQEISAKSSLNIDKLLDKVLLETDLLGLKANPKKLAIGTVVESSLDKGRGYLATILVQEGTLRQGDVVLSGSFYGRIKAMYNERGQKINEAGPSSPVSILGLNGAPSAGDKFNVMSEEKDAKAIANKREQLIRIQGIKTQKHMTLEEIGRRIAIGNFKELNVIVKGDVDGSVEALSDSLIKLSTEQVRVNVIHKAVGAISESDVLLAEASDAVIIGFQVRPSTEARRSAEKEGIEIRLYSVIYDAINEVKDGIEGMLEPEKKEEVVATAFVKQIFKISKVGTIAGCLVKDGKMTKASKVRLIRDGIVVYTGELASLKREKDDTKEVQAGMECGLSIENYNDIKEGDVVEAFKIIEIKRTL